MEQVALYLSSRGITPHLPQNTSVTTREVTESTLVDFGWRFSRPDANSMYFIADREVALKGVWDVLSELSGALFNPFKDPICIPQSFVEPYLSSADVDEWIKKKARSLNGSFQQLEAMPTSGYRAYIYGVSNHTMEDASKLAPNFSGLSDTPSSAGSPDDRDLWDDVFTADGIATGLATLSSLSSDHDGLAEEFAGIAVRCCLSTRENVATIGEPLVSGTLLTPIRCTVAPDLCLHVAHVKAEATARSVNSAGVHVIAHVSISSETACRQPPALLLASYLHATLNILILHLWKTLDFPSCIVSGVLPRIPSWAFVLGSVYTHNNIDFFAHFPEYKLEMGTGTGSNKVVRWTYHSVFLGSARIGKPFYAPWAVASLLRARRHASRLSDKLRDLNLSVDPIFLEVEQV